MANYIFSVGLIPVQEFIAEARRSRDLRTGSAMLSWFMSRILEKLLKLKNEAELIIPYQKSVERFQGKTFEDILNHAEYSLPNRATGYCGEAALETFNSLQEKCLNEEWEKLFENAFAGKQLRQIQMDPETEKVIRACFERSSQCPVQAIWVIKEVPNRDDRPAHLAQIGQLYSNIKLTRPVQIWQGKEIGKCDQCGKREMFSPTDQFKAWWEWQRSLKSKDWVSNGRRFNKNERLCIVCLTKRFAAYLSEDPFPSTSRIASQVWRSKIIESIPEIGEILPPIERILDKTENVEDPADLFYRRSFSKLLKTREVDQNQDLKDQIGSFKQALNDLVNKKSLKIKNEPSNYLSVLTFDGDSMGRKIQENWDSLPKLLFEFSEQVLGNFSFEEPPYFSQIFYVGGDEGLMLTPIETCLETTLAIKSLFESQIQKMTTLSMGITIFDRSRPLGGAIELARQALEQSKQLDDKNALTMTIQTASGNIFSASAHWGDDWDRIRNAIQLINGEIDDCKLSMGWAYDVEEMLQSLPDKWGEASFCAAVTSEIKRITFRKLFIDDKYSKAEKNTKFQMIWNDLLLGDTWFASHLSSGGKQSVANQLHTIAFLSRESAYKTDYTKAQIEGAEQ